MLHYLPCCCFLHRVQIHGPLEQNSNISQALSKLVCTSWARNYPRHIPNVEALMHEGERLSIEEQKKLWGCSSNVTLFILCMRRILAKWMWSNTTHYRQGTSNHSLLLTSEYVPGSTMHLSFLMLSHLFRDWCNVSMEVKWQSLPWCIWSMW